MQIVNETITSVGYFIADGSGSGIASGTVLTDSSSGVSVSGFTGPYLVTLFFPGSNPQFTLNQASGAVVITTSQVDDAAAQAAGAKTKRP